MTKEQFVVFATEIGVLNDRITRLKEETKGIKADIKEAIETFATEHDKEKDIVKAAVNDYLAFLRNQAEFTEFDLALSEIKDAVIYAASTTTDEE